MKQEEKEEHGMNKEIELFHLWSIRRTDASHDWCLVVRRGVAGEGHVQVASVHTMNGPEAEDIQAEVDANRKQIEKQINTFIDHVSSIGYGNEYADTIGVLFYQRLLKNILTPACKRWDNNYAERSEQYAVENIEKSGIAVKLSEEKGELRNEIESLKVLGWDHCPHCERSQYRFEFYYQEQFDEAAGAAEPCVFCGTDLVTCHEGEDGPFCRPKGWKILSRAEFEKRLMELNEEFGCNLLIDEFKSSHADYMHRATAGAVA